MKKNNNLSKVGLCSIVVAILLLVSLSVLFEFGYLVEGSILFYLMVIVANVGIAIFSILGIYFWLYFLSQASAALNPLALLLYIGFTVFSGYWAFNKFKNEIDTNDN